MYNNKLILYQHKWFIYEECMFQNKKVIIVIMKSSIYFSFV